MDPSLLVGVSVTTVTGAGAAGLVDDEVGGVVDGDAARVGVLEDGGEIVVTGAVDNETTVEGLLDVAVEGVGLKENDVEEVVIPGKGPVEIQ